MICFWVGSLFFGETEYELIQKILLSSFGKFLIISIIWSFSFQILSEIRHLFWDMGYGFDLKVSKITGLIVILGSFLITILVYLLGKHIILMINVTKKWLFLKISSVILIPLMLWFIINLVSILSLIHI